jgi:hypothetical protein
MKRTYTLIAALALVIIGTLTGCKPADQTGSNTGGTDTNSAVSTNK